MVSPVVATLLFLTKTTILSEFLLFLTIMVSPMVAYCRFDCNVEDTAPYRYMEGNVNNKGCDAYVILESHRL
jgi:hypothetical protein